LKVNDNLKPRQICDNVAMILENWQDWLLYIYMVELSMLTLSDSFHVEIVYAASKKTFFIFVVVAPVPKRQKCDHWSPCLPGSYAYRILSGGGKEKLAKICFEDEL